MLAGMDGFAHDGLRFDVTDTGPADGEAVALLHGFPQTPGSWSGVVPHLVEAGYRVLLPAQRGYSPGARPPGRRSYRLDLLVDDMVAMADAAGVERMHVVGHDWGGAVAWGLGARAPHRLRTLTVVSTPHPQAMYASFVRSDQALRSWYMAFFQLPGVPEAGMLAQGGRRLEKTLVDSGLPAEHAKEFVAHMREPGALSAALNWYRAMPFGGSRVFGGGPIQVPTLYVWSSGDFALGRKAAELTARHVAGPYRFEVLDGVSHWVPEQAPDRLAALVLQQLRAYPAAE